MQPRHSTPHLNIQQHILALLLFLVPGSQASSLPRILVISETNGWDHQTRTVADSVIRSIGDEHGFDVITTSGTDDYFTGEYLSTCAAVCFINTTGTIFTDDEATAFEQYMKNGGGYVGVHASTDCEYDRSWYAEITGANFNGHPFNIAEAAVAVLDKNHPSTHFITEDTLTRTDEWYFWADNPAFQNKPLVDPAENDSITVLMELIESSISGSTLNHFHPICWYKSYGAGRVWYCGLGHDPETFKDSLMVRMLLGGIRYAAGIQIADLQPKTHVTIKRTVEVDELRLYDGKGRLVQVWSSVEVTGNLLCKKINGMPLSKGVYFAVGYYRTGITLRQRIIRR